MSPGGPNNGDRVTILNGRNIYMASTGKTLTSLEIENGATLDIKTFGGHNFGTVRGAGLLRIAVNPVPLGDYLEFVSPVGGTIEYYDYSGGLATNIPYYNNVIMSGTGNKIIGGPTRAITVNGNFSVTGGTTTLGFGAGNKLTFNIYGDVTIAAGASVVIGNDQIHELNFFKNVVLNGAIDLSNAAQYIDATTAGAANITMKGAADNTFSGTATQLDLYRLIIDKGVDQTYILDLNCTNLKLFAPTGLANSSTSAPFSQENPKIEKALWVRNGTLKLGSNINIPRLSTGGNDFFIPEKGAIWLNGATVATYETGASGNTGLTLYGKLRVSSGTWRGNASAGIVYRTISEIIIEGGLVEVTQLRASSGGTGPANNRSAYVQSGGEFIVTGTGENGGGAQFSLDKTSSIFRMSGGIIRVKNATANGAIDIRADVANYTLTGGLIELTTNSNSTHSIQSTIPFYNFTVIKGTGTGNASLSGYPLLVLNDLNINSTAVFNASNLNLTVGRHFACQGTYTTGTNTTIFNSSTSNQTVTNTAGLTFNNLTIANTFTNGIVTLSGNGTTNVNGSLVLSSGTFNDGGEIVNVRANVSNSSTHTGTGKIRLNNAVTTVANISGSGSGTFTNLELDDTHGVVLNADQTINGVFTLTNGILDLLIYNLTFGPAASISVTSPGATKMIKTAGNRTDGGITKIFDATGSFTYPFGAASKYTPATLTLSAAADFGSITISPVNVKHPFVTNTNALGYFWEVKNTGFTGTKTLSYAFTYAVGDVNGTETSYIGGYYDLNNPSTWTTAGAVNTGPKTIPFNNVSYIAGQYTAGIATAFNAVIVYYSRQNGNWETNSTWSTTGFTGGPAAGTPTASNLVLIGDGASINHTVTVTTNTRASGNLKLNNGSTLDLGVTTGHNFGAAIGERINGNGKLRISSSAVTAVFPAGDFGEFIREGGGTVEYYYTSTTFTLPTTSASPTLLALSTYNNLIITPIAGTIIFPNINLTIYNDVTVSAGAGTALISNTAAGVGTLDIQHNLTVAGILQFQNLNARIINIGNLLQIQSGGTFNVGSANTVVANTINLNGSMVNNGTFDMNVNLRTCNVYFLGTSDATLTGTGALTDFNRLIVNKGSTQTPLLDVNISNLTLSGATASSVKALDIQNGTFKLSSSQTLTISSGSNGTDYLIPFTARLWLNGGNMRITTTGTGAGLLLAGTVRIDAGTFYIEGGTTNDNYIEIAGGGSPSLEVNGGELRVGSQIRRANTSTISALRYTQSGGTVILGTQSAPNSNRALLEVLNNGSTFTMSGGSLVIARQQSGTPTIAALYLQPSSSSVTGGTIQFGSTINTYTPTSQNIQVYSSIPLYDVVINATNAPTVTLTVGALTIRNNFIIGTSTTFNANDFDLNLQGDFTVNGTYTPGENTTYFNSTSKDQLLLGSASTVTFNNLNIGNSKPAGLVSLNINTVVTKTLDLVQGTLNDSDHFINVKGRVNNFSTHISGGTGTGRMIFSGTAQQILSGNEMGVLGNVQLNNVSGVLQDGTATINGVLTFTAGVLDIRSEQLILGSSNSIAGTPNVLSMIKTNGTLSDQGIIKNFNDGTFDFTFPIGTPTKYTPARFNATANGAAGTITVKPINRKHPTAATGFDALGYFWNVNSSGFSGLTINHYYTYADEDINGAEASYVAARFASNWASNGVGTVTAASNLISVNGSGAGVTYITGDYTAGASAAFVIVNTFTSANSGDWDAGSTWTSGTVPTSGAPVIINNNHLVTISTSVLAAPNAKTTFSLEVRGGARLITTTTTFGHNFGNVSGTGTLALAAGIFPGGAYDQFVSRTGGTVEYTGTGYTLPTQLLYNNLTINSTGTITLPNVDITLRGNLFLTTGKLDNSVNNKRVTVQGNLTNNSGTTAFVGGTGTVQFSGSTAQTIGGTFQTQFASVELNKASNAVSLSNSITIANNLKFTSGTIVTNAFKVIAGPALSVTRTSGHVVGNFSKTTSTTPVLYPVGSAASYLPLTINFSTGSSEITASVRGVNPATEKGDGLVSNPLLALWTIEPSAFPASASATVIFQYPDNVRQSGFQQNLAFSARWNTATSAWQSFITLSSPSPNEDPSRVTTTGITQFSDWAIFSSSSNVVLPIVLKSFSAAYNSDHVLLTWVTASEQNNDYFIIEKSRDGTTFFPIAKQESKGNSLIDTKYTLRDGEVSSGLTYYRMHQVDFDGKTTYFKIIVVNIGDVKEGNYVVYPNPTADMVTISRNAMPAHVQVNVYDVAGRMWISRTYNNLSLFEPLELDLTALSAGVYQLMILSEDGRKVIKVSKE